MAEWLKQQFAKLSRLLSEYLKELDEKDQDNEDLQIHKIRRTKFSTPEGI